MYASEHIPGAKNIPFIELETRADNELRNGEKIVLYCHGDSDTLGENAFEVLMSNGLSGVTVLKGGLKAWEESEPIKKSR